MTNKRLDLGGTACYEDAHDAIGITSDGSMSDDEVTPYVVGDYNNMWFFADELFDEALGTCYLEEKPNWAELFRVMKPGGIVKVKSCDVGYASIEQMEQDMQEVGFVIDEIGGFVDADYGFDSPYVLRRPE